MIYRLLQLRQARAREAEASAQWARSFPVSELAKRGVIRKVSSAGEKVIELLTFFGVASVEAWQSKYGAANVAYRHSPSFESDESALAAWRRLAESRPIPRWQWITTRVRSGRVLNEVRWLTRAEIPQALDDARQLCNEAGVALVWIKPLPKARLSGAAWWLSPRKPVNRAERAPQIGRPPLVQPVS